MNTTTPIQPFTTTVTQTVTSFSVSCRTLVLFTSATFNVDSFDINKSNGFLEWVKKNQSVSAIS